MATCRSKLSRTASANVSAATEKRAQENAALNAILVRVATGCEASFAQLYDLTSSRLYGVILRICLSGPEAEDVLQDVYVRIWSRATLFDPERGTAMGWLITLSRHRAIDSTRSSPRWLREPRGPQFDADDPYVNLPSPHLEPLELAMHSQLGEAVNRCLSTLSPGAKASITLAYFYGLTHGEIAVRLDAPLGTVKSWIRRALRTLAVPLAGHADQLAQTRHTEADYCG